LTIATSSQAAEIDPHVLLRQLAPYRQPKTARSAFELAVTAVPFFILWALTCLAVQGGFYWGLLLTLPAGGFLLRLFLIQHDCGHGAFFRSRKANDWTGRVLGIFTLTPYDYWRRSHAAHHAGTGNLDARGLGDLDTLTISEFRARGPVGRFLYRLYRHPIVLFGIGPAYVFLLKHRWPAGMMKDGWSPWISAMGTNLAILAAAALMIWLVGFQTFLLVHIPPVLVAATLGVWLFYVQHQFEGTVWDNKDEWSFHQAALHGSSYYELPTILRWVTANIGIHHVHHLASRIPFYRLHDALREFSDLATVNRIGIIDSLRLVRLALWDEQKRRMVTFREARASLR
jgi:omega-6 fatty acid desaturase (delta-12 desaturase)